MIKPGAILKTPLFQPQLGSDLNLERPSSNSKRERERERERERKQNP
jgi:hypothetical protein